jgi:hypothetical protein
MNVDILSNTLEIKYYKNIIDYCKKSNIEYIEFENKLKQLTKLEPSISESETVDSVKEDENENNTSESKEIVYSDDYLYKRKWTKLSNVHKIIKVKEFVSKLLIDDKNDKDILKNELVDLIKSRYLTKKDTVKYDETKGNVIAIPILTFKNGKYSIIKY